MYANYVASRLNGYVKTAQTTAEAAKTTADAAGGSAKDAWDYADEAQNNANDRVLQTDYDTAIAEIWNKINSL